MNILIIGSSGVLGNQLYQKLKFNKNMKIFHNGLKKKRYDLSKKKNIKLILLKYKPDVVLNSVGITNIDYCEKNKKKSYKINVELVNYLFQVKKKYKLNFFLIQFSTDHVYDSNKLNSEKDKVFINNEYTRQKLLLEKKCLKEESLILRINFFGKSKINETFDSWLYKSFISKKKFNLAEDQYFSPLRIKTISLIMKNLLNEKKFYTGIYNLGSKQGLSKKKFGIFFSKKSGIYNNFYVSGRINKICKIKRSQNMLMKVSKFEKDFGIKLPKLKNEILSEIKESYRL